MWFNEIAQNNDPGTNELVGFVSAVKDFLLFVTDANNAEFQHLWAYRPGLQEMADETLNFDIVNGAGMDLAIAIPNISQTDLHKHGLTGRPLRFKIAVINVIANEHANIAQAHIRSWFDRLIDAIDALLNSIIDAANGTGGLIKEFKDALKSLN